MRSHSEVCSGRSVMIHPTAIIHENAELGEGVQVGPYSIIEGHVKIGARTKVGARVTIEGHTTIGEDNEIFTGAVVGSITQDKKADGGVSYLKIGDRNKIREYVTINPGTLDGTETVIGSDNLLMAYCHVAHDCIIGNHTILANAATLAGHVIVEDRAIIGGLSGVHQFVRIGSLAIIGGCSKVVQDIPPYMMVDGHPAKAYGVNSVGMDRAGMDADDKSTLKKVFRTIFKSGNALKTVIADLKKDYSESSAGQVVIAFLEASERGVCK